MRTIYKSVVIPNALYGCEMQKSYTYRDILLLDRLHILCVKCVQGMYKSTNTSFALITLKILSIEVSIDYKKRQMIGQLCLLTPQYLVKRIFVNRLVSYCYGDKQTLGFIQDVYRRHGKYSLLDSLESYLRTTKQFTYKCTVT